MDGESWSGESHNAQRGFERLAGRLLDYLRTRTADHWIMFIAGLAMGLLLG